MSTTPRRRRRSSLWCSRRSVGALIVGALGLVACSGGDDDQAQPTLPATTLPLPAGTAATDEAAPTTVAEASEATPPPTAAAGTTLPPSVQPAATTLPPSTTTTEPLSVQELLLQTDGFGSARFGAEPEGVIAYVSSILGGNTADTGWVAPDTFAVCLGTVARKVDWGVLSLLFTDESRFATGRRHFIGYEYGRVGQIGDEPVGLRTPGGVTLGSRVVDVLAEFPEAAVNQGETDINIPDNFYVSDVFYGLLTGVAQDDVVTVVFAGDGCGE